MINMHLTSTGNRRLRLPEPLPPYEGNYDVHRFGSSCPQQRMTLPEGLGIRLEKDVSKIVSMLYEDVTIDNEDCKIISLSLSVALSASPFQGLTINVFTPEDATKVSNLPVVVVSVIPKLLN